MRGHEWEGKLGDPNRFPDNLLIDAKGKLRCARLGAEKEKIQRLIEFAENASPAAN